MAGITMLRSFGYGRPRREHIARIPVAPEAIAHSHRHMLVHPDHSLDFAVAGLAQNPCVDVGPVIKIDMIRQGMNSHPEQGLARVEQRRNFHNVRAVGFRHLVAVHALLHGRDPGLSRLENTLMAIGTWNTQDPRVELMGKRYRLRRRITANKPIGLGEPSYTGDCHQDGD
jgi:hypothetical protein